MKKYRMSKYNPVNRLENGAYAMNEWTDFSDVGTNITIEEYEIVEKKYLLSIEKLCKYLKIKNVEIRNIEICGHKIPGQNKIVEIKEMLGMLQDNLRNKFWCEFYIANKIKFSCGYDYYLNISFSAVLFNKLSKIILSNGLFLEEI